MAGPRPESRLPSRNGRVRRAPLPLPPAAAPGNLGPRARAPPYTYTPLGPGARAGPAPLRPALTPPGRSRARSAPPAAGAGRPPLDRSGAHQPRTRGPSLGHSPPDGPQPGGPAANTSKGPAPALQAVSYLLRVPSPAGHHGPKSRVFIRLLSSVLFEQLYRDIIHPSYRSLLESVTFSDF